MREKYQRRIIRIIGESQKELCRKVIDSLPIDTSKPICVTISEEAKTRKLDQNAFMWAGTLKDISEQAYVNGRTYTPETWHEFFKREYLPDIHDPELTKEGYLKWDIDPKGNRILRGSTTQLTIKGFAQYLTQVEAYGAGLGTEFITIQNDF